MKTRSKAIEQRLGSEYWSLWAGSAISNLGDGMLLSAAPLLATRVSSDPVIISGLRVASYLPWLLFALVAGVYVDRHDRCRTMLSADVARALILAGTTIWIVYSGGNIAGLYVTLFLVGSLETLFDSAGQAILPSIVAPSQLATANGRLITTEIVMNSLLGPALGVALFSVGASLPFGVDAISYGVSVVALLRIRRRPSTFEQSPRRSTIKEDLLVGVRWLGKSTVLRHLLVISTVWNISSSAIAGILVLYVRDQLQGPPAAFGFLLSAGALGGIAGSLLSASIIERLGRGPTLLLTLIAWIFVSVMGALARVTPVGILAWCFGGFLASLVAVIMVTLRQELVPDELRGRVNGVYRLATWGLLPIGALSGGALSSLLDLSAPFWASAVLGVLNLMVAVRVAPSLGTSPGVKPADDVR